MKDPNVALLLLAAGVLFVYAECVRPGAVWFVSVGGVMIMLGLYGLTFQHVNPVSLGAILIGACLIVVEALRPMHGIAATMGVLLINGGGATLCGGMRISWAGPILTVLSSISLFLLRFASVAWNHKHVALSPLK